MTDTTAVPADTTEPTATNNATDITRSSASGRRIRGTSDAWRWMTAGIILMIAVGTQLVVDLQNSSGLNAADFAGNYWIQLVVIAVGLALVVGGIVKSRRH